LAHGFCTALFGFDISLALRDDVIVDYFHPSLHEGLFISFHPAESQD
jgi:hypothetical protein